MATIDLMDKFGNLGSGGIKNNGALDADTTFFPALRTMRTDFIQVKAGDSIVYKNMNGMSSSWNILSFYTGEAQGYYTSGIAGQTTPQSGVWTATQDGYVRLFGSFPAGDKISVTMTDLAPDVEDYLSQYNAMNYRFLPNSIPKIVAHIQEYLSNHPIADSTTLQSVIDAAFKSYLEEIQETADTYIAEAVPPAAAAAVDAAASPALEEITAKADEAAESARQAGLSQQSAEMSEENALTYRNQAQQIKDSITAEVSASVLAAQEQATLAQESAQAADQSADTAEQYVAQARAQAAAAAAQAQTASGYASDAQGYMQDASGFAQNASDFADNAAQSAATFSTDPTLTISGKAADAKATGDQLSDLKSASDSIFSIDFSENGYINNRGENSNTSSAFRRTDYIPLSSVLFGVEYELYLSPSGNVVSYYDETKTYLGGVAGVNNLIAKTGVLVYPEKAKYVRFACCKASAGITNPDPVVRLKDIVQNTDIGYKAIKTINIGDNAVTKEKCNFIIHDPETNYIDKSEYSNGYINARGVFISNDGWRATGFCALLPETQYFSGGLYGGYCAFYKADKTVIAGYGANAFTVSNFTTPAETAYARFSLNASSQSVDAAWINIKNEKPKDYGYLLDGVGILSNVGNPCDYDGREIAVFNKILCVGDSMTEGTFNHLDSGSTQWVNYAKYSYPTYLHKMTGVDVTNLGHGGQTSVQWYNTEQDSDLSGYDCAIIQLGINDFGTYGELGADTKTAFQNIITKLKTENKNIKIFVANIIPATSYSSAGYKAFSAALLEWLETTYASDPNVIPVDIQQYGHTGNSSAFNAGHLTALGYRMLAQDYIGFISSYIKNNGSVFREVQFIGTDYWYVNPNS